MYGWIWRTLPGNAWVKLLISLLLVLAIVYALFTWVFPWAEPLLPFSDVTVDQQDPGMAPGTGGAPQPVGAGGVSPTDVPTGGLPG
ncbi:hypothetical protein [Streptomyces sp. SID3343]|uniref:hypothetical protein n=1 Tax=Streptomyces sp. SID3343 TaxID=2690260 RepID=UPI0013C1D1C2|nr:hypothetical protein [Streptomyces sp. SID3343]MYW01814.1 hypothetical protein [Streptomyces sp. SID3343]